MRIEPLRPGSAERLRAHLARHRRESGNGQAHFMPFDPADPNGPKGLNEAAIELPYHELGWQRWYVLISDDDEVVGHVSLKSDALRAGLHRCELGIGIEDAHRAQGHGERLMARAIEHASAVESLVWIDLHVMQANTGAIALYEKLGFRTNGRTEDRFRIQGEELGDLLMSRRI